MPPRSSHVSWMTVHVPCVPVREVSTAITIFLWCTFGAATIQGWLLFRGRCLFLWKAHRHQQWLDKVHVNMSDTVIAVTHFQ